ncbi:hypothetical protein ACSSS7_008385 [Eimeria intestinalis]
MEFPAARTPDWLRAAFDGPEQQGQHQHQQQQQQKQHQKQQPATAATAAAAGLLLCPPFVFKDLDTTPRLLLATPSGTTATPAARRRSSRSSNINNNSNSSSNSSNSNSSSKSMYEERAAAVRSSIREALFRQALFQIQNVEVQTLSKCGAPRILAAAAVRFDLKQQQQQQRQLEAAGAAADNTSDSGLLTSLMATAKRLIGPNSSTDSKTNSSSSSSSSSSSYLGELLRVEDWSIDRCGSTRVYEVRIHRDESDFFSLSLRPQSIADRLRLWWFKFADTNDD